MTKMLIMNVSSGIAWARMSFLDLDSMAITFLLGFPLAAYIRDRRIRIERVDKVKAKEGWYIFIYPQRVLTSTELAGYNIFDLILICHERLEQEIETLPSLLSAFRVTE
jgi:hypothetical protein